MFMPCHKSTILSKSGHHVTRYIGSIFRVCRYMQGLANNLRGIRAELAVAQQAPGVTALCHHFSSAVAKPFAATGDCTLPLHIVQKYYYYSRETNINHIPTYLKSSGLQRKYETLEGFDALNTHHVITPSSCCMIRLDLYHTIS